MAAGVACKIQRAASSVGWDFTCFRIKHARVAHWPASIPFAGDATILPSVHIAYQDSVSVHPTSACPAI